MTALLAEAMVDLVRNRLGSGLAYVRLPELVAPFPIEDFLDQLDADDGLRIAVLLDEKVDLPPLAIPITQEVTEVIQWRNQSMEDDLLIIGDLEKDRASGLEAIPTLSVRHLRRRIFDLTKSRLADQSPQHLVVLLDALRDFSYLHDLMACSEYCESLEPFDQGTATRAQEELWRLRLLPDVTAIQIDRKRLRLNADLVASIRTMDATTVQRLIARLGQLEAGDYESLRSFASTGDRTHLRNLTYESVLDAVKASSRGRGRRRRREGDEGDAAATLVELVTSPDYDEKEFLERLDDVDRTSSEDRSITLDDTRIDWEFTDLDSINEILQDTSSDRGYEETAGSVEIIDEEVEIPSPGLGREVRWRDLEEVRRLLERLERRAPGQHSCSQLLQDIVERRASLIAYLDSIPLEGLRTFLASKTLRKTAAELVDLWVAFLQSLVSLKTDLDPRDAGYLRPVAELVATTDLRIVRHPAGTEIYMLPLHPAVLEPRIRAAQLFIQEPQYADDLFDLVNDTLDPGVPSISVPIQNNLVSVGYVGKFRNLPHYGRGAQELDSPEVAKLATEIVERFINIHPYARECVSVGLVDPGPVTAKALLKEAAGTVSNYLQLTVYEKAEQIEEMRQALDEAREDLLGREVTEAAFEIRVVASRNLNHLLSDVIGGNQHHVLLTFGIAEIQDTNLSPTTATPPLGSLITEWEFSTNPLEDARPVIRSQAGSNKLAAYVETQAGLFDGPVPSLERSPLLRTEIEEALGELAERSTWIALCESASALVPPVRLGEAELLGRISSASHVSFVYSNEMEFLLAPVLRYLQGSTWIHPQERGLVALLLKIVRVLPEGLLGFFKRRGQLSSESVLGRLGMAAALAYLEKESGGPGSLVVSLDTDVARRWLGLRDVSGRRADLLKITLSATEIEIEAIEIKARTDAVVLGNEAPEVVREALEQVSEMERVLCQVFELDEADAFTPSRREILKRQVFLEAIQQWDVIRQDNPDAYEQRIEMLNRVFDEKTPVKIGKRVFVVSPSEMVEEDTREYGDPPTRVVLLGVSFLRRVLEETSEARVEIPAELLDAFLDSRPVIPQETEAEAARDSFEKGEEPTLEPERAPEPGGDLEKAAESGGEPSVEAAERPREVQLAERLHEAFLDRGAQFRKIHVDMIIDGPSIVQIPFTMAPGAKLSVLENQEEDLARDLGVQSVRISNWVGHPGFAIAEIPRDRRHIVDVSTLSRSNRPYPSVALGAQIDFTPLWVELDSLPHLLIGGTTGSGKSMLVRSILYQLTHLYGDHELDLVLIDGKGMADYLDFRSAPHFKAADDFHLGSDGALELLADVAGHRLDNRISVFRDFADDVLSGESPKRITTLRDLLHYADEHRVASPLRPLVVVVDEFAELVGSAPDRKRFEDLVKRFNQLARAVGGHFIAATQRPSVDVVAGVAKANFARLALRVQQAVDSRVILDENGAETLVGKGDLLFKSPDIGLVRLQGYLAEGPYRFP